MTFSEDEQKAEILDQLDGMESALVDYDTSLAEGKPDAALVHIMFRHAHNLKSCLSMVGLTGAGALIHAVEERFDVIRKGGAKADRNLLDTSLEVVDRIRGFLETGEDSFDPAQLLENLGSANQAFPSSTGILPFPLRPEWQKAIAAADPTEAIFRIEKTVTTKIDKETYENLPILDTLREIGSIIALYPPWENLNRSRNEDILHIIFSTDKSKDDLFFIIFDPLIPLREKLTGPDVREPVTGRLRALIVEDDFVTRHLEVDMLRSYADCDVAVSGKEALEALRRSLENEDPYRLIILDMLLPEGNGFSVLTGLRSMEDEAGIRGLDQSRVVVVSGVKDMETVRETFREQADAYLVKPVNREDIKKTLEKLGLVKV